MEGADASWTPGDVDNQTGRKSAALFVCGRAHETWSLAVVGLSSRCEPPPADGRAAVLLHRRNETRS